MDVAPRYLGGNSFVGRRDPRIVILVPILSVVVATQLKNVWMMAAFAVVAFTYYASAKIPFPAVRANWMFVAAFVLVFAGINGIINGSAHSAITGGTHLFTIPVVHLSVTGASLSFVATIALRLTAIAATGFPMAYAIRPGDLSVAFARLGIPSRFAYGIDLTFAFMPNIAANLRETTSAQRLRGYQRSQSRNPIRNLRELAPLMVPVTISTFVDAEDTVDALDLRGFGTQKRTWLRELSFGRTDWLVVIAGVSLAVVVTALHVAGRLPGTWGP